MSGRWFLQPGAGARLTTSSFMVVLAVAWGWPRFSANQAVAQRQMENLGRGVIAVNQDVGSVFVGWRMLGTDPDSITFNLYRSDGGGKSVKLNDNPIKETTNFVDVKADLSKSNSSSVRPVLDGQEQDASAPYTLPANAPAQSYLSIPLQTPQGYSPNDASVGDLDGDGEYEVVLHQVGRGRDNSRAGFTTEPILQAYRIDGTLLWTINLGKNIREGAHYTQFMVYDFDGDGKAEVACKTADGTVDGKGKVIGNPKADWRLPEGSFASFRNQRHSTVGYILAGPEYLTIFDGQSGAALATTSFIPPRHPSSLNPTSEELAAIGATVMAIALIGSSPASLTSTAKGPA